LIQLLRALPVMLTISTLTGVAHHQQWLDWMENTAIDFYLATVSPNESRNVVLVTIGDADYRDLFDARSPLEPGMLRQLIDGILASRPAVLGVDVLTDETAPHIFRDLQDQPVVWVQDASPEGTSPANPPFWHVDRVLGQDGLSPAVKTGLAIFPRDRDGLVRRYHRELPVHTPTGVTMRPTLPSALVSAYCAAGATPHCACGPAASSAAGDPLWLNLAGDRYSFRKIPAAAIDALSRADRKTIPDLTGAIVILGGTFAQGRDSYATPIGFLSGVELTAFAAQSELECRGIRLAGSTLMGVVDFLMGVALVAFNWLRPPETKWHALGHSLAMLVLAVAASYLTFRAASYWATFIPMGVGVWLEDLYSRFRESRHLERELERYRTRYGPL
jgi:CHASE2 domain-containing sensor protein